MHLQTNSDQNESNPVFIPKRMQSQTKSSFVVNGYENKFRSKEISVNDYYSDHYSDHVSDHASNHASNQASSLFPNTNFKTKPIKTLKTRTTHRIPVEAEIHSEITENALIDTNGFNSLENQNSKTMTAIRGILKYRTTDSIANGVVKQVVGYQSDHQTIISENNLARHKTHNRNSIIGNMKNCGTTPRRKSSSVQFDVHNIKESTRVELNANPRGLASISSARRESSNSSSSLSIIQQSVPQNPALTYDFPKSSQRMSDLRKILNPEIEKEDSLKKLGERLIHCDCFELNLNNAAKIITALVLVATFILVVRALYHSFS